MTLTLYTNTSEVKKVDKDITVVLSNITGTLKNETNITDPIFLIEDSGTNILGANYLYVAEFNRYYYITNIESFRNNMWSIECHCDVLMSFKDEIRANSAIIMKQEKMYNLYMDDGTFKSYQNPIIYSVPFPTGFSNQSFVLAVAGSEASI